VGERLEVVQGSYTFIILGTLGKVGLDYLKM